YSNTDSKGRPTYLKMPSSLSGWAKISKIPDAPDGENNLNPEFRRDKYKQITLTLNHEQQLNDHITAFLNYGHYKENWYYCLENSTSATLLNEKGDYYTDFELCPLEEKKDYLEFGLRNNFKTGALTHNIVIGMDKQWRDYGIAWKGLDSNPLSSDGMWYGNIYDTGTGSWVAPVNPYGRLHVPYTAKARLTGWSAIDSITALDGKLTVLMGVHKHIVKQDSYKSDGTHTNGYKTSAVSPSFGINYVFSPRFAVYANHTEEFNVGTFVNGSKYINNGQLLDPAKSKQNEVGIKFKTGEFLHKLSYFDIKEPSIDDIDLGYKNDSGKEMYRRTYNGETRNKGIEYTAAGSLSNKWNLVGGFMWLDAKQVRTNGGLLDGKSSSGIPRWTGNLGLEYKANDDFSILARANLIGNSKIWYTNSSAHAYKGYNVPGYFRFDLGVNYKTEIGHLPVRFRAMCYNVTNTHYWQPQGTNLYIGSPRTYMLSAEFQF
ncbi:TonB-dependent receptor, partial [Dialister sp.]|uniref:TonB-dependent receptor n=1 Tax=Dialister sp. TaxID=1955814 RepID=UPI003EFC3644